MLKKAICYIAAFLILVVCWTNVLTTPFLVIAFAHFLAMWLIAQGVK